MSKFKDLIGKRFGKLTAIERVQNTETGTAVWRLSCDCGGEKIAKSSNLLKGCPTHCGCLEYRPAVNKPKRKHKPSRIGRDTIEAFLRGTAPCRRAT